VVTTPPENEPKREVAELSAMLSTKNGSTLDPISRSTSELNVLLLTNWVGGASCASAFADTQLKLPHRIAIVRSLERTGNGYMNLPFDDT